MKKLLCVLICVILSLSVLPLGASAAVPADLKWTQISETTAQITFYVGMGKKLTIPTTIEGLTVTEISDSAFYGATLESVTLPSKLQYIGDWAFCSSSIKSIKIPNTVKEIGESAFQDCTALQSVTIGNGLTEINEKTFYGCSSVKTLKIGKKVREIDDEAFRFCSSIKTLNIPDNVKSVDKHAFADCTSLKTINIGKGLRQIGEYAFCDTENIEYYGKPSKEEMEILWKQNVKADVVIHIANKAAQKHFKSLKKDYIIKHVAVAKKKTPTISANTKSGAVTVRWSKVKGAKNYKLTMGGAKSATYSTKSTNFKVSKLVVGKTYTFKVRADFAKAKTSKTISIKVK